MGISFRQQAERLLHLLPEFRFGPGIRETNSKQIVQIIVMHPNLKYLIGHPYTAGADEGLLNLNHIRPEPKARWLEFEGPVLPPCSPMLQLLRPELESKLLLA